MATATLNLSNAGHGCFVSTATVGLSVTGLPGRLAIYREPEAPT